ncbi:ABC transporter permease subunit [Tessaracoccus coleopterorum]|uniref:hypothetical protein n=1 Tax=Tessaracoccus coleopterorum TaxID=2714950 RepID=UPI001E5B4112|nr:hypothetical protein [Tessaracoccus coleopterorum]
MALPAPRRELTLANFTQLATEGAMGATLWGATGTSLVTALAATGIAVTLGVLVALVASRRPHGRLPARGWLRSSRSSCSRWGSRPSPSASAT